MNLKLFRIWFGPGLALRDMKLNRRKVYRIIWQKQKVVGTREIARDLKASRRRIQQIWKHYQETGRQPVLGQNFAFSSCSTHAAGRLDSISLA
jgi:hypothetical protein